MQRLSVLLAAGGLSGFCPIGDQLSACAVALLLLLPEGSEVLQVAATCIVVPYFEL